MEPFVRAICGMAILYAGVAFTTFAAERGFDGPPAFVVGIVGLGFDALGAFVLLRVAAVVPPRRPSRLAGLRSTLAPQGTSARQLSAASCAANASPADARSLASRPASPAAVRRKTVISGRHQSRTRCP